VKRARHLHPELLLVGVELRLQLLLQQELAVPLPALRRERGGWNELGDTT